MLHRAQNPDKSYKSDSSDGSDKSDKSDKSDNSYESYGGYRSYRDYSYLCVAMASGFLKISADYTNWNVYRKAVVICDVTELFINRAIEPPNRTIDQMRQAARSCKQNIVEGIADRTVSADSCIKLIGIARGSVRELLEDYCDYLRQHNYIIWDLKDIRTLATRKFCIKHDDPKVFVEKCRLRSNETVANIMITLIRQMDSMLAKVLKKLEKEFIENGGIKEAMTAARRNNRGF